MAWLIDTDVAIHLRDGDVETTLRLLDLPEPPKLSIISLIELEGGASPATPLGRRRRQHLERLLDSVDVVDIDRQVVTVYGRLIQQLGFSRRRVLDRLIAATAIINDLTLVTINGADFRGIPDLKLDVWPTPGQ